MNKQLKKEFLDCMEKAGIESKKLKEKKEQSLEKILRTNNWQSMKYKKEGYHGSKLYEVITNEGEKTEVLAYYCKNCGYMIGTPSEQNINHIGFLSSRIGKGYYCDCGELISEKINEWG